MSRVPSPTQTEWNTFQVMANPAFVNVRTSKPVFHEEEEESRAASPVQSEVLDSISVVAEKSAQERYRPSLPPTKEDDDEMEVPEDHASVHEPVRDRRDSQEHIETNYSKEKDNKSTFSVHSQKQPEPKYEDDDRQSQHSHAKAPSVISIPEKKTEMPKISETIRAKARELSERDILLEKEALLEEINMMQKQGLVTLYRELGIKDSLEEIQFQYDRAMSNQNAMQTVEMAKKGVETVSMLLEMLFSRLGLKLMEGFSKNLCKDMTRFNRPMTKLQRRYWRGGSMEPETELAMIVFGSVLITIMQNKGLGMFANMIPTMGEKTPPMARPVVEKPSEPKEMPKTASPMASNPVNTPAIPVMRRPTAEPKTVQLNPQPVPKVAKKRNDEPPLQL